MTTDLARHPRLEQLLARVLRRGTWFATCVIALGLALILIGSPGATPALAVTSGRIVAVGIAFLILLPVLRVLLMLVVFVIEGDYRFGAIAAIVLAVIVLGAALSAFMAGGAPG
jgi:uncharacterized membrane protein